MIHAGPIEVSFIFSSENGLDAANNISPIFAPGPGPPAAAPASTASAAADDDWFFWSIPGIRCINAGISEREKEEGKYRKKKTLRLVQSKGNEW